MKDLNLDKLFETIKGITSKKETKSPVNGEIFDRTFLVLGLGNPGREYRNTRHNVGFMVLDRIAEQLGEEFSRTQFKTLITTGIYHKCKVILAKPQTFMNKSGIPTRSLVNFYKLDLEELLVVYDDIDLPFGTIRLKQSGGSAGHKGMNSIIENLNTQDFSRLRIGVGRPQGEKQAANYVLKPFTKEEENFLVTYVDSAAEAVFFTIDSGTVNAMTKYNKSVF